MRRKYDVYINGVNKYEWYTIINHHRRTFQFQKIDLMLLQSTQLMFSSTIKCVSHTRHSSIESRKNII